MTANPRSVQVSPEMGALGAAFNDFAARWSSSARIADAFDGFRLESESIFNALAMRIERENAFLYPVADRVAADRNRRFAA